MTKKCEKCGYVSEENKQIVLEGVKNPLFLCSICNKFAPNDETNLKLYLGEKIDGSLLNCFRKFQKFRKEETTEGMAKTAKQGNVVSRAPFGYKIINKNLVPAENADEIREIFEEFLSKNVSLNKLAKKHNLTVNGLKKILSNFTYIGKVKFAGQIHQGNHEPIISNTLFNHVQDKLNKILKTKK